jgi:hypothetical protein
MRNLFKPNILKISIALVLVTALVVGFALPVAAEGNGKKPPVTTAAIQLNMIKGKVVSIAGDGKSFEVQPAEGSPVTITVDDATKYFKINGTPFVASVKSQGPINSQAKKPELKNYALNHQNQMTGNQAPPTVNNQDENTDEDSPELNPEMEKGLLANCESPKGLFDKVKSWFNNSPKFGHNAKFSDIEVGDSIVARVVPESNLAKQVLIIKTPVKKVPVIQTVRGNITGVDTAAQTITIQPSSGEAVMLKWDSNTTFVLKGLVAVADAKWGTLVYKTETKIIMSANLFPAAPAAPPVMSPAAAETPDDDGETD